MGNGDYKIKVLAVYAFLLHTDRDHPLTVPEITERRRLHNGLYAYAGIGGALWQSNYVGLALKPVEALIVRGRIS